MSQLLAGIRVLELSSGISGPYLGKLFADHGADVIKVEPPSGDPARRHGPWGEGATPPQGADSLERSPLFLHLNTNKRSVTADVGTAEPSADDLEFVRSLAAGSDIVIESFGVGHLDSIGLGYKSLTGLNPGIVLTSITPFGQTGPYAEAGYRGSDIVTYAMGGPMWGTGIEEREPIKLSGDVTSYQVGNLAAVPTLAALMTSQRTGRPAHIDVSAFEAQAGTIDRRASYLLYEAYTGSDVGRDARQPQRASPVGFYPTSNGWALVFTLPSWAPRMVKTLTEAGLGGDEGDGDSLAERFANPAWIADPDLPDIVETSLFVWLAGHTQDSVATAAQVNKWGVTPLNAPLDLLDDPHFAARGFFVPVEHAAAGTVTQLDAPFRVHRALGPGGDADDIERTAPRPAPLLGEHDAELRQAAADSRVVTAVDEAATAAQATADAPSIAQSTADAANAAMPAVRPAPSEPGITLDETAVARPPAGLPLDGIRVLDMTVVWAGPACTMYLGDLGAQVIRVDNPFVFPTATRGLMPRPPKEINPELGPLSGYPDHDPGRRPWNRQNLFSAHARGKLSCTLDPRTELGRATLHRLVRECDVIVENNSLGVLPKLGLDWDTVHSVNPRTVVLRMPPMGLEGPYSDWVGFGANFEALCGLTGLRGYADEDPTSLTSVFHMDPASAATAAFALLAVLRRRDGSDGNGGTGVGEQIEFSQSENVMQHIGEYFIDAAATGTRHRPVGNRSIARAPQGCYPCAVDPARPDHDDEWAVIACETDDHWHGLARLIDGGNGNRSSLVGDVRDSGTDGAARAPDNADQSALADDERLATLAGRIEHHDRIDQRISAWTSARTSAEVFRLCQQAGVPAGPVLRESQLRADPQMSARCWFRENGSVEQGWHSYPGRQWRWDGPEMPWRPIGILGDANEYVYRDLLGLDDAEWQALCDEGHITRDYLNPDGTSM